MEDPGGQKMRMALYFPHTEVRRKNVVHTSLLMWDSLEFIVPFRGYHPYYDDDQIAEAMEVIGQKRIPDEGEKQRLHTLVEDLVSAGVPETFRYSPASGERDDTYEMWPQKLMGETWDLLRDKGLTDRPLDNHSDEPGGRPFGHGDPRRCARRRNPRQDGGGSLCSRPPRRTIRSSARSKHGNTTKSAVCANSPFGEVLEENAIVTVSRR
jgi:hypothetical protein